MGLDAPVQRAQISSGVALADNAERGTLSRLPITRLTLIGSSSRQI